MMSNPFKRELSWLILALSFAGYPLPSGAASAEDAPWYQFEVIILARISANAGGTEYWPQDPGTPSQLNAIPLLDRRALTEAQAREAQAYRLLPSSEWQLAEHEARLRRSRNYRPLLHLAWRQPMVEPEKAQPVYLDFTSDKGETVTGTIQVGIKRYLHLETDLLLQRPATGAERGLNALGSGLQTYRMLTKRRMRSEELHYLDHPVLGVLVIAKRFELPEPPAPTPVEIPTEEVQTPESLPTPGETTAPALATPPGN